MIENVTTVVAKRACSDSERMNSRSVVDVSTSKVSSTRKFPIQLESLVTWRSVRKFTDYVSIALSDIALRVRKYLLLLDLRSIDSIDQIKRVHKIQIPRICEIYLRIILYK